MTRIQQLLCLFLTILCTETVHSSPVSDCLATTTAMYQYTNLPGSGWDNLVNANRGQIIRFDYSQCKTTGDGFYLIPDNVFAIPSKSSNVDIMSEMFDHYSDYTSTTSKTINLDGGVGIPWIFSIHGKYSSEYQQVKTQQVSDNSQTIRVGARYEKYFTRLQNEIELDDTFLNRVSTIANHLLSGRKRSARYESQLLIRDFGTHIVTGVHSGAAIYKVEQLNRTSVKANQLSKEYISRSAGLSFFGNGIDYTHTTSEDSDTLKAYLAVLTHSSVRTHGGPAFKPLNFSINDWVDNIGIDIVAIDRSGDPLNFVINTNNFQNFPETVVKETASFVEEAIATYYKYNTIKGCTSTESPNYNFAANVDDGSCQDPGANLTFGGLYQTCEYQGDLSANLCDDLLLVNPKTGSNTCPEGYEPVQLFVGNTSKTEVTQECESYLVFWKKCHNVPHFGSATYSTYWCASVKNNVPIDSGYLFGGLYTSTLSNPIGNGRDCPASFTTLRIAEDINVCVSDDYENGEQFSLPFAGFFSCQNGNPLANKYYSETSAPKSCPAGYSQHLAVIEEGCEISYCVKMRATVSQIHVKSPPFMTPRSERHDNSSFIVDNSGTSWTKIFQVPNDFPGFISDIKGWITYDGKDLNFTKLMSNRNKQFSGADADNGRKEVNGNIESLGHQSEHHKKRPRKLTRFELSGIVAVSVIGTLMFLLFIAIIILKLKPKRNDKQE